MHFIFDRDSWAQMTSAQRVEYCVALCREAQTLGDEADKGFKDSYLEIASQWLALGREIQSATKESRLVYDEAHSAYRDLAPERDSGDTMQARCQRIQSSSAISAGLVAESKELIARSNMHFQELRKSQLQTWHTINQMRLTLSHPRH